MTNTKPSSKALIIYNGKLLLLLRDKKSSIPDPNTWSLIGGEAEENETYEKAIVREIKEEINVVPEEIKYLGKIRTPDENCHAIFLVKPTKDEVEKIKIGKEGQKVEFFSIEKVKKIDLATNTKIFFDLYGNYLEETIKSNTQIDPKKLGLK